MRSRRSNSTASETLPATIRRDAVSARRSRPAPTIASDERQRAVALSPSSIASIALPTSQGISTVMPIASEASTIEQMFCRR